MKMSYNGVPCPSQRLTVPTNEKPMIHSTPSTPRTERTNPAIPASGNQAPRGIASDQFTAEQSDALRSALAGQPEIRPEVVERGRALASDPSYPSMDILRRVGGILLQSPDPSEESA